MAELTQIEKDFSDKLIEIFGKNTFEKADLSKWFLIRLKATCSEFLSEEQFSGAQNLEKWLLKEKNVTIRKACLNDVEKIVDIINGAVENFKKSGIDQWQKGYPNQNSIENDIKNDMAFVYDDGEVKGYFALTFSDEPTYEKIFDGEWKTDKDYGVLHRVAVKLDCKNQGIAQKILDFAKVKAVEKGCNLRIDTHEENVPMLNFVKKNDFLYCGIIYVADGTQRFAFELLL